MSQYDILDFLELHEGEWFDYREIAESLRVPYDSVCRDMQKLRKKKYIISRTKHDGTRHYTEVKAQRDTL